MDSRSCSFSGARPIRPMEWSSGTTSPGWQMTRERSKIPWPTQLISRSLDCARANFTACVCSHSTRLEAALRSPRLTRRTRTVCDAWLVQYMYMARHINVMHMACCSNHCSSGTGYKRLSDRLERHCSARGVDSSGQQLVLLLVRRVHLFEWICILWGAQSISDHNGDWYAMRCDAMRCLRSFVVHL